MVGLLQDTHFLGCDVAQDAYGQAWSGEGMTCNKVFGHTHRTTDASHLVLEEPLEGFAELEPHLLRQATDVMV